MDQYFAFVENFYNYKNNGTNSSQRLGQYFVNIYNIPADLQIDNLFFIEEDQEALDIIERHYVSQVPAHPID